MEMEVTLGKFSFHINATITNAIYTYISQALDIWSKGLLFYYLILEFIFKARDNTIEIGTCVNSQECILLLASFSWILKEISLYNYLNENRFVWSLLHSLQRVIVQIEGEEKS